jgi:hypothetical protein
MSNVFIGDRAGWKNTEGRYNTYVGKNAGQNGLLGNFNTILGAQAAEFKTGGDRNIFIGNSAGSSNAAGSTNIFIGVQAGSSNTGSSNIFIGNSAGSSASTMSNKLYIENSSGSPLIYGEFDNRKVSLNGSTGIQRNALNNAFEVNGNASKTTAGSWLANSDARIKTDISDIENALETIMLLHPVKFRYSDEWLRRNPSIENRVYYNFIAQEFGKIFPELVKGSGEYLDGQADEILQIDTWNAQIVSIKAIQDLVTENRQLKSEMEQLRERLAAIEAILNSSK